MFIDEINLDWFLWDCCVGLIFIEVVDDEEYGVIVEFFIGVMLIVMGFINCILLGGSGI